MVIPGTGKIMIAGGDARPVGDVNFGVTSVLEYDYRNKSLVKSPDGELDFPRWYPTAVTLANGTILILGGKGGEEHGGMGASPYPELYTPGVGWKTLEGAADPALQNNWYYPRAWLKSDGDVILYGSNGSKGKGVYSIDPTGDGDIRKIGTLPFSVRQPRCRRSCSSATRCSRSPATASSGRSTSAARARLTPMSATWARRVIGRT